MANFLTWLSRKRFPYEPLITVEISRSRLLHNLNQFRMLAPHGTVAPVLKSNAYGHGLFEIAHILEHEHHNSKRSPNTSNIFHPIPFFVVDSYFEAVALRSEGIKTPLLVIGYTRPEIMMKTRLRDIAFTVTSIETLEHLESTDRRISIHLKIDTGMRRQGIMPEEVDKVASFIAENKMIEITGICSHLYDADNSDPSTTEGQIIVWNRIVHKLRSQFISIKYYHLAATDGHRYSSDIVANVSRLGIGLYGLEDGSSFKPAIDLKPVLEMKTIVTGVKKLKRDETVGYSGTFKAEHEMTIATVPVGYFEGVDRKLSNIGSVQVGTDRATCPIIGRVSMNITSIDVTHVPGTKIGTPATIISNDPVCPNSLLAMARICNTITYDLAIHIPAQLKRVVVA